MSGPFGSGPGPQPGISGVSGASGSGASGVSGYSGVSGFSGASGTSGKSGFSGTSGVSGTGTSGASGTSGYSGVSGFSGVSGSAGSNTVTTSVLLSSTSVNLNEGTTAKQTLYTVPSSRRAVITNIVMQKFSAGTSSFEVTMGWNASADNVTAQFGAPGVSIGTGTSVNTSTSNATDTRQYLLSIPGVGAAGDILGLIVQTPEGSALTAVVDVYGYLTDTSGVPVANTNGTGDGAAIAPASVTTTGGIGIGVAAPSAGLNLTKTITAGGTTGAQTINKSSGSVNFAASATSLVVTNSLVTSSSVITATVGTNDTTLKSVQAVAGSGSFTLFGNAAATSECRVNFTVSN